MLPTTLKSSILILKIEVNHEKIFGLEFICQLHWFGLDSLSDLSATTWLS